MDIRLVILHLSALLFPVFVCSLTYPVLETTDNPSITYTYSRFSEIEKQCRSVLPSPSELKPDDNRGNRIKKELSFLYGDWDQELGGAPLMTYHASDIPRKYSNSSSLLKLASFKVMDVDPVRRSENMISVSATMYLGITRDRQFSYMPHKRTTDFYMAPGQSKLTILFEGVYIESEENGRERLMCLLGTSMKPNSNEVTDSPEPVNGYGYTYNNKLPLVQDDQIMLILRYPKTFTLTTRGIRGEMKSLKEKNDPNFFNGVQISSQLGPNSIYQFGSEELLKACSPYPYHDKLVDEDVRIFKGGDFCGNLKIFMRNGMFNFVPSWVSGGTNDWGRLGPFVLGKETKATTDSDLANFRLFVQNLQCESEIEQNKNETAKVSAVFRVFHLSEDISISQFRTGLSGMTLSAEGMWTSSSGQLCMVGCVGLLGATSSTCSSRICLYIPLTFSITQRSSIYGTISNINETEAHISILFEKGAYHGHVLQEYQWNKNLIRSYKYSKVIQASTFLARSEPSALATKFRKSLLRYPSSHGSGDAGLSHLFNELSLGPHVVPYSSINASKKRTYVEIQVLSLGSHFRRYWPQQNCRTEKFEKPIHSNVERIEISGHLIATGAHNVSLFMEGLYDPVVGKMYLIGCKDVRVFQKIINSSMNLERGMDCQIEINIDYPPENTRWLINSKVRISISSKRNEEDSLHFNPIILQTSPITYKEQVDDILFRKVFEGTLRIVMLIMAIFSIDQQLRYMNKNEEASTYISLVMLGIQALSYSIPLITGKEILFKWKVFQPTTYGHQAYWENQDIGLIIKTLLLYALVITVRLYREVRASRVSLNATHTGKKIRFPSDKLVLLITLAIHILGFSIFHVVSEVNDTTEGVPTSLLFRNSTTQGLLIKLLADVNDYSGLVQDFFLIPQIIGNFFWRIQAKPLSKFYYIGFTMMRVLLHAYDYIRDPVFHPQYFPYNEFQNLDSKHGNIAIAITMIVLAMIVHIQQRGTNQKVSKTLEQAEHEIHALESDLYARSICMSANCFINCHCHHYFT